MFPSDRRYENFCVLRHDSLKVKFSLMYGSSVQLSHHYVSLKGGAHVRESLVVPTLI